MEAITQGLTAFSILFATVTWIVTFVKDRRDKRVAHTADLLANLSTSERLAEASYCLTRLINEGRRVSLDGVDPVTEAHVVGLLDYYEFVCDLYEGGILSEETVVELRGRLMRRTWEVCEPYVMETRARQGRRVYACFERFVEGLPQKD